MNCRAIRTEEARYVCHHDGREELYDLATDPGEYTDVSGQSAYASSLHEHRPLLLQRLMSASLPLRREWAY